MKVAVVGGSIAGLSTGIALSCIGCEVDVYEASPAFLRGKGGGLVVQHEMLEWMMTHGIATLAALTLPGVERQVLDRDGRVLQRFPDATPFTSWEAVYHQLRVAFPAERYHLGAHCVHIQESPETVTLAFAHGTSVTTDLVIGADGVGSMVRGQVAPAARPTYAGYVAWRGVIPEAAVPAHVVDTLASRFTLFQGRDFHILAYMIPGEDGALAPGTRRLNWVWYWNTGEDTELADLLVDADGHPHRSSVPAGKMQARHVAAVRDRADAVLPGVLAALVRVTPHPLSRLFSTCCVSRCSKVASSLSVTARASCVRTPHRAPRKPRAMPSRWRSTSKRRPLYCLARCRAGKTSDGLWPCALWRMGCALPVGQG
jgi:2-polyprenyl-6-methoxyphenol hydroxylase-like FAD-dependent oxidoreductase